MADAYPGPILCCGCGCGWWGHLADRCWGCGSTAQHVVKTPYIVNAFHNQETGPLPV